MKLITTFFISTISIFAQESFEFVLKFTDSENNVDSITLGYAPSATNYLDEEFSEIDNSDQPVGPNIDVRVLVSGSGNNEFWKYQSKKQIASIGDCGASSPTNTIAIFSEHWPVTISWNPQEFMGTCTEGSLITSSYSDFASPNLIDIQLKDTSSVTIPEKLLFQPQVYELNGDTANLYWHVFNVKALRERVSINPRAPMLKVRNHSELNNYLINGATQKRYLRNN